MKESEEYKLYATKYYEIMHRFNTAADTVISAIEELLKIKDSGLIVPASQLFVDLRKLSCDANCKRSKLTVLSIQAEKNNF